MNNVRRTVPATDVIFLQQKKIPIHFPVFGLTTIPIAYVHWKIKVKVTQSSLALCDPKDHILPSSSIQGILQTSILEWVDIPFSRGSFRPRDWTQVSFIAGRFFTIQATRKAHMYIEIWCKIIKLSSTGACLVIIQHSSTHLTKRIRIMMIIAIIRLDNTFRTLYYSAKYFTYIDVFSVHRNFICRHYSCSCLLMINYYLVFNYRDVISDVNYVIPNWQTGYFLIFT